MGISAKTPHESTAKEKRLQFRRNSRAKLIASSPKINYRKLPDCARGELCTSAGRIIRKFQVVCFVAEGIRGVPAPTIYLHSFRPRRDVA